MHTTNHSLKIPFDGDAADKAPRAGVKTGTLPEQWLSFNEVCGLMRKSRSGLYKLMASDPAFPKPVKDGEARSARAFFVASEIASYQEAKLAGRAFA
ncbi:hypothetical protein D9M70_450110 [compost metagenome]